MLVYLLLSWPRQTLYSPPLTNDNIHDARRKSGLEGELGECERRERGDGVRPAHDSAARAQRRRELASEHGHREVPDGEECGRADGAAECEHAAVGSCRGDDVTPASVLDLPRKPLDEGRRVRDLALGFLWWKRGARYSERRSDEALSRTSQGFPHSSVSRVARASALCRRSACSFMSSAERIETDSAPQDSWARAAAATAAMAWS